MYLWGTSNFEKYFDKLDKTYLCPMFNERICYSRSGLAYYVFSHIAQSAVEMKSAIITFNITLPMKTCLDVGITDATSCFSYLLITLLEHFVAYFGVLFPLSSSISSQIDLCLNTKIKIIHKFLGQSATNNGNVFGASPGIGCLDENVPYCA